MKHELKANKALFAKLMQVPLRTFPELYKTLDAPSLRGVYVIHDPQGQEVLHVGSTPRAKNGIAQRLGGHMSHKTGKRAYSSFVKYYEPLGGDGSRLRGKYKFRCLVVDCGRQRALLEAYAAGRLCPAHIGGAPGNLLSN